MWALLALIVEERTRPEIDPFSQCCASASSTPRMIARPVRRCGKRLQQMRHSWSSPATAIPCDRTTAFGRTRIKRGANPFALAVGWLLGFPRRMSCADDDCYTSMLVLDVNMPAFIWPLLHVEERAAPGGFAFDIDIALTVCGRVIRYRS